MCDRRRCAATPSLALRASFEAKITDLRRGGGDAVARRKETSEPPAEYDAHVPNAAATRARRRLRDPVVMVPLVGSIAIALFATWAFPVWRVPEAVVVGPSGEYHVRTRWIALRESDNQAIPHRVPIVTRLADGTEHQGLRVRGLPGQTSISGWEAPDGVRRVIGTIYRVRRGSVELSDGWYPLDTNGLSPVVKKETLVDYKIQAPWKRRRP